MTMEVLPSRTSEATKLKEDFLELTGYSRNDILSWNPSTREFFTRNGGFYRMSLAGRILHLGGPSPDPEDRL